MTWTRCLGPCPGRFSLALRGGHRAKTKRGGHAMVAGRERCHEEATRTAPVPAEPHGPRRCGGPEHSVGLSIDSQEFFARFLRVGGLAAQPHRSSENACVVRLTEPLTKSTGKVCRSLRRCRQPQKLRLPGREGTESLRGPGEP